MSRQLDNCICSSSNDSLHAEFIQRWPNIVTILILPYAIDEEFVRGDAFKDGRRLPRAVCLVRCPLLRIDLANHGLIIGLLILSEEFVRVSALVVTVLPWDKLRRVEI